MRSSVAALIAVLATVAFAEEATITVDPAKVPVGGLAVVRVAGEVRSGTFDGKPVRFFRAGERSVTLVGIDLDRRPGRYPLRVATVKGDLRSEIEVVPKDFPVERLTVAKGYTDLDPKTLARVRREQRRLDALWANSTDERLWQGRFAMPADGRSGSPFGLRRFFNEQPRSPHAGIDIKAPTGAPVRASNRGRVVLADDFFFTGKTVVLDHGLGLFTLYVHLSEIGVRPGDLLDRGVELGKVGATGRVTGPHLHFATRLGAARFDPEALLDRVLD